jgi:hypothetical protein
MMDTNEQVEPTMKYLGQPTHVDGKPMHTLLPLSSEVYQYGMSVMTKDHYTMCTARSKDEAMKIVQALNRAPAFDAMVEAAKTMMPFAKHLSCKYGNGGDSDFDPLLHCCDWGEVVENIESIIKIAKGEA